MVRAKILSISRVNVAAVKGMTREPFAPACKAVDDFSALRRVTRSLLNVAGPVRESAQRSRHAARGARTTHRPTPEGWGSAAAPSGSGPPRFEASPGSPGLPGLGGAAGLARALGVTPPGALPP